MSFSSTLCAYIAGFLDADGSIYVRLKPNTTYRFGYQIAPYIVFFQSEKGRKQFEKIFIPTQLGYMRYRKDGICEYVVGKKERILTLLTMVGPYLILKKEQARLLRLIIKKKEGIKNKNDFLKIAQIVEKFRNINYSKKMKKRILTP